MHPVPLVAATSTRRGQLLFQSLFPGSADPKTQCPPFAPKQLGSFPGLHRGAIGYQGFRGNNELRRSALNGLAICCCIS